MNANPLINSAPLVPSALLGLCALMLALPACDKKEEVVVAPVATPEAQATAPVLPTTDTEEAPKVGQDTGLNAMPEAGQGSMDVLVDPGALTPEPVTKMVAVLHPLKGSKSEVMGTVTFEKTDGGIRVVSSFDGLPSQSKHAHHIHVFGDCSSDDGKSAGTHFHFRGSSMNPPPGIDYITGDLGNLEADAKGQARAEMVLKDAELQGKFSILGRSVIVHEKPNDPSQPPMGGAGGRISCGVIGLTSATADPTP